MLGLKKMGEMTSGMLTLPMLENTIYLLIIVEWKIGKKKVE
jgi:hypothetical protein